MSPQKPIAAVMLDLDGTLVDTAGEIGLALSRTLVEFLVGVALDPDATTSEIDVDET